VGFWDWDGRGGDRAVTRSRNQSLHSGGVQCSFRAYNILQEAWSTVHAWLCAFAIEISRKFCFIEKHFERGTEKGW